MTAGAAPRGGGGGGAAARACPGTRAQSLECIWDNFQFSSSCNVHVSLWRSLRGPRLGSRANVDGPPVPPA